MNPSTKSKEQHGLAPDRGGWFQKFKIPTRVQSLFDRARCLSFERFTMHKCRSQWCNRGDLTPIAHVHNIDLEALEAVACRSNPGLLPGSLRNENPYSALQAVKSHLLSSSTPAMEFSEIWIWLRKGEQADLRRAMA